MLSLYQWLIQVFLKNLEQLLKLEFCYCMSSGCEYLNFWLQYCHNILQTYSMCEVNVGFKVLDFIIQSYYIA